MRTLRANQTGVTFIELIVFLVIVAVLAAGFLVGFTNILAHVSLPQRNTQAIALAQQRLEIILASRNEQGFSSFTDLCQGVVMPPDVCRVPAGFSISSSITADPGNASRKTISVIVSGNGQAKLSTVVTQYEGHD